MFVRGGKGGGIGIIFCDGTAQDGMKGHQSGDGKSSTRERTGRCNLYFAERGEKLKERGDPGGVEGKRKPAYYERVKLLGQKKKFRIYLRRASTA